MSTSIPPSSYTNPVTNRPPLSPRRQSQESTRSTRRKPVSYINVGEIPSGSAVNLIESVPQEVVTTGSAANAGEERSTAEGMIELVQPPIYILHADRPIEDTQTTGPSPDLPPSYTYPPSSPTSTTLTTPTSPNPNAQLPAYHPSSHSTSPHTLPRTLFFWGFICPLLWIIGVVILCVPLKVYEDDFDLAFEGTSRAGVVREDEEWMKMKQRERMLLDEKVVILRRVSFKIRPPIPTPLVSRDQKASE